MLFVTGTIFADWLLVSTIKMINRVYLRLFSKYILISPLPYAIGNYCEEVRFALLKSGQLGKRLIILTPPPILARLFNYETCNKSLIDFSRAYSISQAGKPVYIASFLIYLVIFILQRTIYLTIIKRFLKKLYVRASISICGIEYLYSFPRIGVSELWTYFEKNSKAYSISEKSRLVLEEFRENLLDFLIQRVYLQDVPDIVMNELKESAIVIHTRSSSYYNDGGRRNRNMQICDYLPMINHLADCTNRCIVIIGDHNDLVNLPNKVLNMPVLFSHNRDLHRTLELLFITNCSLYIGTQSGPWDAALLFKKRIIGFNFIDISTTCIDDCSSSSSVYFIKPLIGSASLEDLILNVYDLNTEEVGHKNKFSHTSEFLLHAIKSLYVDRLPIEIQPSNILTSQQYEHQSLNIIANKIAKSDLSLARTQLINSWSCKADKGIYSEHLYYLDEIARLRAKVFLSTQNNCNAYLDVSYL